ncbi:MAG: DNA replication complex subunit Gins51 [Promethearchaeota archaeon]
MVELLLSTWKNEQDSRSITKLPGNLEAETRQFVETLLETLKSGSISALQMEVIEREIQMVKYLWNDIMTIRRWKINRAVKDESVIEKENLTDAELKYFSGLQEINKNYSDSIRIKTRESETTGDKLELDYTLVRILKDTVAIVGLDLKTYGPFKKEDLAYLPRKNAELLEKIKAARKIVINGN